MQKKLLFSNLIIIPTLTAATSVSCVYQNDNHLNLEKKSYPFFNLTNEYDIDASSFNIYTTSDSQIHYVDIDESLNKLQGFLDTYKVFKYRWIFKNQTNYFVNGNKMSLNWKNNTISFKSSDFFSFTMRTSNTNFMSYLKYKNGNTKDFDTNKIVFKLNDYETDLLRYQRKTLIPFWLFNLLFCSQNYYNLYFDGSRVLGAYFNLDENDKNIELIKKNKLNNITETPEQRKQVYNQFLFTMDHFYGLKNYKNISKFADFITLEQKEKFLSTDPLKYNEAYMDIIYGGLNELHSSINMLSFYNKHNLKTSSYNPDSLSPKLKKYKEVYKKLKTQKDNQLHYYNDSFNTPYLYFHKDLAFISFNNFRVGQNSKIYDNHNNVQEDAWKHDTYMLMRKALEQIANREKAINQKTMKIVLDLSQNGGGSVAAMIKSLGFLTEKPIVISDYNTLDKVLTTERFLVDTKGNGNYKNNNNPPKFNWYILTGINTFSAANSFSAIAKNMLIAKTIGQDSGGGMCSVLPLSLMDGTSMIISSTNTEVLDDGNKGVPVESGIEPNISIEYDKFYDLSYLDSVIR